MITVFIVICFLMIQMSIKQYTFYKAYYPIVDIKGWIVDY